MVFNHVSSESVIGDIYSVAWFASAEIKHVIAFFAVPTFRDGADSARTNGL
jgi:hypothetical protein